MNHVLLPAPERIQVTGGAGGTAARLEDLDRCSAALRAAADDLSDAWWALSRIQSRLDEWGRPPLLPDPTATHAAGLARQARVAVDAVRSGPQGLLPLANDLRSTADDVSSARKQYAVAEDFATKVWRGLGPVVVPGLWHPFENLGPGPVDGLAMLVHWRAWLMGGDLPADAIERAVDRIARTSPVAVPWLRRSDEDPVPRFAGALLFLSRIGRPARQEVRALPVVGSRRTGAPPRTVTDLVEEVTGLTKETGGAVVGVTEVPRADGTSAWVVTIPGTQAWMAWGDDPLDLASNFALMSDEPADSTRAVMKAMESAGIGANEPVVLAGHSQGGLVATQLAATGGYAVAAVLTAGSPTASHATPAVASTLGLENTTDPVVAADGKPPRDEPLRTTVRDRPDGDARRWPSAAHATDAYERLAAEVDESGHPSVMHWREQLAEVLGDGEVATTREYALQRFETAR